MGLWNRKVMTTSVQHRLHGRNFGTMKKEKEEELGLFLDMRRREKERSNLLLQNSDGLEAPLGSKTGCSTMNKIVSSPPRRKNFTDEFLNSENNKNDYDWLITPPGTPLFPSLEMEARRTTKSQPGTPKGRPTSLKSRLANSQVELGSRGNPASRQPPSSPGWNSSSTEIRRPASSGGIRSTASRPSTPTGRPTLSQTNKGSRPSTPTSRPTLPSSKPMATSGRFSGPSPRSSTPTSRATAPPSRPTSRPATPTRRPSTPASVSSCSAAPPGRSSSVSKSGPIMLKNPVPSRGSSPTVKSRPWNPSEMPGFSLDIPPNLRTSMPERPVSASRGRPQGPISRSSVEAGSNGRPRRQSCSPSRGRAPNGMIHSNGTLGPAMNRAHSNSTTDYPSPVLMGTKMVERVVNMRKLAPPKQDDLRNRNILLGKSSSSLDSSGFGRSLSKKSLDMAMRHMDIRRSMSGGSLRPLMTNIPASSMYSVRSGPGRNRTMSVPDSPLATSSNASSEQSVNNNALYLDVGDLEDDVSSERGSLSSMSCLRGR